MLLIEHSCQGCSRTRFPLCSLSRFPSCLLMRLFYVWTNGCGSFYPRVPRGAAVPHQLISWTSYVCCHHKSSPGCCFPPMKFRQSQITIFPRFCKNVISAISLTAKLPSLSFGFFVTSNDTSLLFQSAQTQFESLLNSHTHSVIIDLKKKLFSFHQAPKVCFSCHISAPPATLSVIMFWFPCSRQVSVCFRLPSPHPLCSVTAISNHFMHIFCPS